MTTVDDKLKLFAKIIFENVERESERKITESAKSQEMALEAERQKIMKESEDLLKQAQRKAEDRKRQIISKANIDKQHTLLKKRKEILDRTIEDIKGLAVAFTSREEYLPFLERCIESGLSRLEAREAVALFCKHDMEMYGEAVKSFINKYKKPDVSIAIQETNEEILGGCIYEDAGETIRIDCSIASIIEDNKGLIGNMLMDNLQ